MPWVGRRDQGEAVLIKSTSPEKLCPTRVEEHCCHWPLLRFSTGLQDKRRSCREPAGQPGKGAQRKVSNCPANPPRLFLLLFHCTTTTPHFDHSASLRQSIFQTSHQANQFFFEKSSTSPTAPFSLGTDVISHCVPSHSVFTSTSHLHRQAPIQPVFAHQKTSTPISQRSIPCGKRSRGHPFNHPALLPHRRRLTTDGNSLRFRQHHCSSLCHFWIWTKP